MCYEKCRFQAHTVTNVQTIKEIKIALKLILLDKKVQTATHPRMFAYRIPNDDDFNDDGETGAEELGQRFCVCEGAKAPSSA